MKQVKEREIDAYFEHEEAIITKSFQVYLSLSLFLFPVFSPFSLLLTSSLLITALGSKGIVEFDL
jgi:hypothetical protein